MPPPRKAAKPKNDSPQSRAGTVFPVIFAVETSCDETACALFARGKIIAERLRSQMRRHAPYGGVVPELAARDHLRALPALAEGMLARAKTRPTHIAYTAGPGLASSLLAGASFARALAFAWEIPALAVNHLEGHILSPLLARPDLSFPYTALLASGGHTQLWRADAPRRYRLLGATMDDAAGEALDKTARLLNAGTNGADLEKLAATATTVAGTVADDGNRFSLPSPAQPGLRFSFSGLKTAARRLLLRHPESRAEIAAAMQNAVAEGLAKQARRALAKTGDTALAIVGGVMQNKTVAAKLQTAAKESGAELFQPHPRHCGDNAAMIALTANFIIAEGADGNSVGVVNSVNSVGNSVNGVGVVNSVGNDNRHSFRINPRWQPNELLY